jgi:hypothetical protein
MAHARSSWPGDFDDGAGWPSNAGASTPATLR